MTDDEAKIAAAALDARARDTPVPLPPPSPLVPPAPLMPPPQAVAKVRPTAVLPPNAPPNPLAWPEPVNFFVGNLEAESFNGGEFPLALSEYPLMYAQYTGFDPSSTLCAALICAASAISNEIQLCADEGSDWRVRPILFHLNIASSGAGKSPPQKAMATPIEEFHHELAMRWKAQCDKAEESGDDEGGKKQKLPQPRALVSDTTIERLSDVLAENPQGVLYRTDEFSTLLGSQDQYKSGGAGGGDRGSWIKLFEGDMQQVERVKRGSVYVPIWGLCILSATTHEYMRRYAEHLPADGFIQRFLVCIARGLHDSDPSILQGDLKAARDRYKALVHALFSLHPGMRGGIVQLSPGAKAMFDAWRKDHQALADAFETVEPALASHLQKYPSFALRLALVYHCISVVNGPAAQVIRDAAATQVSAFTLSLAIRFLEREMQHARAMYLNRKGHSSVIDVAREVAQFILVRATDKETTLQRRDLVRGCKAFNKENERTQDEALRMVESFGWIRIVFLGEGYLKGHPTRFVVNPGIARKFALLADAERDRRELIALRFAELRNKNELGDE